MVENYGGYNKMMRNGSRPYTFNQKSMKVMIRLICFTLFQAYFANIIVRIRLQAFAIHRIEMQPERFRCLLRLQSYRWRWKLPINNAPYAWTPDARKTKCWLMQNCKWSNTKHAVAAPGMGARRQGQRSIPPPPWKIEKAEFIGLRWRASATDWFPLM